MSYCIACNECYIAQEVALDINRETLDKRDARYADKLLKCPGCQCPLHKHMNAAPPPPSTTTRKRPLDDHDGVQPAEKKQTTESPIYSQTYPASLPYARKYFQNGSREEKHLQYLDKQYDSLGPDAYKTHPFYKILFEVQHSHKRWECDGDSFSVQMINDPRNNVLKEIYDIYYCYKSEASCKDEAWDRVVQWAIDAHVKLGDPQIIASAKELFPEQYQ